MPKGVVCLKNKSIVLPIALGLLYLCGFVAAIWVDLPLNLAVYSPQGLPVIFTEAIGWYPAFIPTIFGCLLLCTRPKPQRKRGLAWAMAFVAAGGFAAMLYQAHHYFAKRGLLGSFTQPATWIWLALSLCAAAVLVVLALRVPAKTRPQWEFVMFWVTALTVGNHVIIYALKTIWQRTRFDDMVAAGSFDAFTPWFRPLGNGGSSFPSGHTANAACLFFIVFICDVFAVSLKKRVAAYGCVWAYIVYMAASRIVIGRHFLSDTLAASGIIALLVFALRRSRLYQKQLFALLPPACKPKTKPEDI